MDRWTDEEVIGFIFLVFCFGFILAIIVGSFWYAK